MPLAIHYNLEVFFQDGRQLLLDSMDYETKYVFGDKFPKIQTDADLHKAVVEQMYHLADALLWLHNDLGGFEMQNSYLAHMDLKPENILVHGDPQDSKTPAGQWMITDFGISAFYKESHKPTQEIPTIRDVTSRLTSLSEVVRGRGPYQPPEIGLERKKEEFDLGPYLRRTLDFRQCDVWSFGCVLSDVLAFALDRSRGIQDVREARTAEGNDNFYKFVKTVAEIDHISASNTQLKESFVDWGEQIGRRKPEPWVLGYLDILFQQSIVIRPADRKSIETIRASLSKLSPKLNSAVNPKKPIEHIEPVIVQRPTQQNPQGSSGPIESLIHGPVNPVKTNQQSLTNGATERLASMSVRSQSDVADFQQRQILDRGTITKVPLSSDASVIAVALESTGEHIAILCKARFSVFPTMLPTSLNQKSLDIPTEVKWNNIRIAHPWLAVFGAKSSGKMVVSNATLGSSPLGLPDLDETWYMEHYFILNSSSSSSLYPFNLCVFQIGSHDTLCPFD